jgi:hypothetical protein
MDTVKSSSKLGLHIDIQDPKTNDIQSPAERLSLATRRDIDSLLVFTKAVAKPTLKDTIKESRFQMRFLQLWIGVGKTS